MEIKHTVEILTKDIQDIEKLVRNFNNYPIPPQIELDLAMAKLRNIYDLLSLISNDIKNDFAREIDPQVQAPVQENIPVEKNEEVTVAEENKETINEVNEVKEQTLDLTSEDDNVKEEEQNPIVSDTEIPEEAVEQAKEQEVKGEVKDETLPPEEKKASILAEKFASNKSLNERIAPGKEKDMSSKLKGESIDSIQRNIGINDRFMIIRELLGGNSEEYNIFIQNLDACTNFNECFKLIESRFHDRLEHEGVKILVNLSRRRFISSGNV